MRTTTPDAAAIELFELVVSGPLRKVEAIADGSWIVHPVIGQPLVLTGPDQVAAYVVQAHGTGPAALAPAAASGPAAAEDEPGGCGCVATLRSRPSQYEADMMQARAVSAGLGDFGVSPARRSVAYDQQHQAAAVRVDTTHGIYSLHIPLIHHQFVVMRGDRRDGVIGARRVPAVRDSLIATLYAAYLRERAVL
ncbi:hypothetical protein ACIOEX_11165 [Streptomyces sp. NPDC087850]|uniref:hypothetical protein n=1 Tax=Streptomyces sp. NPDC087850 TaxID=3365809 RepID=UPI0037F7E54A